MLQIEEIKSKTALNPIKSRVMPFDWDLNVYRGCTHSCVYCFARYTHEYLGHSGAKDFDQMIKIKTNIPEILEKQINSKRFKGGTISIGGISDVYQPLEKKYKLTRKCLEVILEKGNDISICTKSPLILRDLDLLKKINQKNFCAIAFTVTTLNQKIASKIEPFAPKVKDRIEAMKKIKKAGIPVGLHLMPVMPGLTDSEKDLRKLLKLVKEIKIDYIVYGNLGVRPCVRKILFPFIQKEFPEIFGLYRRFYGYARSKKAKKELRKKREFLHDLVGEYGLHSKLKWPKKINKERQMKLKI
ncbi:radical SAM protein [Patescibacteria group bacterium]